MRTTVMNMKDCPDDWRNDSRYVYCGRPGKGLRSEYGNPHVVGWCQACGLLHTRDEAIEAFRAEVVFRYCSDINYRAQVERLRGMHLVCFCAPERCHAEVYVELLEG